MEEKEIQPLNPQNRLPDKPEHERRYEMTIQRSLVEQCPVPKLADRYID